MNKYRLPPSNLSRFFDYGQNVRKSYMSQPIDYRVHTTRHLTHQPPPMPCITDFQARPEGTTGTTLLTWTVYNSSTVLSVNTSGGLYDSSTGQPFLLATFFAGT